MCGEVESGMVVHLVRTTVVCVCVGGGGGLNCTSCLYCKPLCSSPLGGPYRSCSIHVYVHGMCVCVCVCVCVYMVCMYMLTFFCVASFSFIFPLLLIPLPHHQFFLNLFFHSVSPLPRHPSPPHHSSPPLLITPSLLSSLPIQNYPIKCNFVTQ